MTDKQRFDTLGRRIPNRDYSARTKKIKEKYGNDFYNNIGTVGGRKRTRGYFGYLKDTDPEKFAEFEEEQRRKAAETNRKRKKTK
jgi:hypothetical protein